MADAGAATVGIGLLGAWAGWDVALYGLAATGAIGVLTWIASVVRGDVSLVDRVWSVCIAGAGFAYAFAFAQAHLPLGPRAACALGLAAAWALRLSVYITARNWGHGEDRRYQTIRERNQPNFAFKSLYLVFALQAVLAWIVSAPLHAAVAGAGVWTWLDTVGATLAAFGIVFEAIGDWQMSRFKARPENKGRVMDQGLWRYTRHPNYFGEFCIWWGLWLMALAAGGGWSIVSPLLMSVLLLKVSGVTLLEADLTERRPAYRDYIARTNAFFPGPPRAAATP
jgi:steroid 5-alpha reductase family enzyme